MNDPELTGLYQSGGADFAAFDESATPLPQHIGRYRVERILGQGGFGLVYLAHDEQLQRLVAIKVPHRRLVAKATDAQAYLAEARTVAGLDHPHIVPVYDVGSTEQFPCFVVSKYIDGAALSTRINQSRLSLFEAVELAATVAEALHHAHHQGLVHRDVKPGNILIDKSGKPFVTDFGLALREQEVGKGPHYAGTPAYMSPEQARGEGHRVDGRSDIFSLGVMLYELLTGRRPFQADSADELLVEITSREVRPPRQWDDTIPKELERICLKALSKRASERYTTAKDMADDLRHFLAAQTIRHPSSPNATDLGFPSTTTVAQPPATAMEAGPAAPISPATPTSHGQLFKIVPRGLRSFDAHDADFFLELLPGPRDRDGLPDCIRFWKTRIEETDPDNTFAVGLIYGPSGCGKSSLVKAGLLPRLSHDVMAVYIEATAGETETRLLNGLRKACPGLPASLGLKETLAALRRGQGLPAGKKVLIVLDQFEQWLHAKKQEENTELLQALRQCDGGRVQCIVLVRDDFWLAVSRFMRDLEVDLVSGGNIALVDLFDRDHARKVLAAFGRAFGKLPETPGEVTPEQKEFLKQAVAGLAQENKIICVRLALFAEMMKGRAWTPATLKEVGGTEGVGVTFLEETFSSPTANPRHRYHQKAVRADLKVLLPVSGMDIKGSMKSYAELLEASGYGNRPKDFDDLIRILDNEIRLITPTDPEGKEETGDSPSQTPSGGKYYQLTHDYLVHSIRDWLTRKQKETRRGRAELLLADRAAVWNARPENRQLPSLAQWLQIRWLTTKQNWTPPQRRMMRKAGWVHVIRAGIVAAVLVMGLTGLGIRNVVVEMQNATRAERLVDELLVNADIAQLPSLISDLRPYRRWADPRLKKEYDQAESGSPQKLRAALALLPVDEGKADYLRDQLLVVTPQQFPVVRDALLPHKAGLIEPLWSVALNPQGEIQPRFQAACALATYAAADGRWEQVRSFVAGHLVTLRAADYLAWQEALRGAKDQLFKPLTSIYMGKTGLEQSRATEALAEYAAGNPQVLADLLMDADEKQFAVIYAKFKEQGKRGLPILTSEFSKTPLPVATEWTVQFYQWASAERFKPPTDADWEAVLKSPILDELRLSHLSFYGMAELGTKPTNKVPSQYFAAVAKTEVTLGNGEYALSITFDDGVRVWLDNEVVFQNWGRNGLTTGTKTIGSKPGRHKLQVDYFQIEGEYALDVEFSMDDAKEKLAKRQANAAVALLKLNQPANVWPLLKHSPDPKVRSYMVHRFGPLGVDAGVLIDRLEKEPDVTIRRALILSLGEYGDAQLSPAQRAVLVDKLLAVYEHHSDSGLHAAAEWLLRKWGQGPKLKALDEKLHINEAQLRLALNARRTGEQGRQLSKLAAEIEEIQKRLADGPAAWERKLHEPSHPLPASLQAGLIAHYPLDESEGRDTANAVKDQPGGTYRGTGKPEWVPGVAGRALQLDGQGGIDCGTSLELERTDSVSYGCWFLAQSGSNRGCLVGKYADKPFNERGFAMHIDPPNRQVIVEWTHDYPKNALIVSANVAEPAGRWHHLFVTYDGSSSLSGVGIYLDGRLAPMKVLADRLSESIRCTVPLQLGRRDQRYFLRGKIDDVRIYNRRLSGKEVDDIYQAGVQSVARVSSQERLPEFQRLLTDDYRLRDELYQRSSKELVNLQALQEKTYWESVHQWYINGQGQTMVVVPGPVEFVMGSPPTEADRRGDERQHKVRIGRAFALAAKPVTVEQYRKFDASYVLPAEYAAEKADLPVNSIDWYRAAKYCNLLSAGEGIPEDQWCYEILGDEIRLNANYLGLSGYRLPTEAEMEYATRAAAITSRYFGETEELLPKYARYFKNSQDKTGPVGSLKPNDFGLFDVQGNVWTWCQESYRAYPHGEETSDDTEDGVVIDSTRSRVLRGGAFSFQPADIRSAVRRSFPPGSRFPDFGFRPARTLPPASLVPLPSSAESGSK